MEKFTALILAFLVKTHHFITLAIECISAKISSITVWAIETYNHLPFQYLGNYFVKIREEITHPKLWGILSAIGLFVTQYIFSQWTFAVGFFIIFIMDTISGVYVAHRTNVFSGEIFRTMLMDKCLAYFTIIVSFSAGTKVMLQDSDVNIIQYLNVPFYSLFIGVELRSVVIKWYRFKKWSWLGDLLRMIDKSKKETIDEHLKTRTDENQF